MKDWPRVGNIGASDESCGCTVFFFFFCLLYICLKFCLVEFEEKATNEILVSSNPLPLYSVSE